ncbi:MAG: DUF126 domain-containing protein [Candidatus Thermoplasmatota archaeon]|nr:DUF126 domain-containing protein [Candidatus Thermoplasmatota archaeon]MBS3789605.1 DUF126 domain-containing protein [Candidatus Thermoplasmatota archaeon]
MILSGRGISRGKADGTVVKVEERVSFLGDVDPTSGKVFGEKKIIDSIFVFPGGKGSTVGSYVIYQLKKNENAPRGMINKNTETIVASGAIISGIPLIDGIDTDLIKEKDEISIDGDKGTVEIKSVERVDVVTAFLKKDNSILLLKRSEDVKTFKGRWAGVSGYLETDKPVEQAKIEIEEEVNLDGKLLSGGDIVRSRDGKKIWNVHPFLFEVDEEPELNWEHEKYQWVQPNKIKDMKTVPKLWEAYISARCSDEN